MPIRVLCLVTQPCLTLCDPMDCSLPDPLSSSLQGDSPGKNTGVSCHALLQEIFPTQWSNPGLPHCRQILYQLSHKGSPRILEWVAYLFCSGSSQPRDWTGVSCTAGKFFMNSAIREAHIYTREACIYKMPIYCLLNETKPLRQSSHIQWNWEHT